MKKYQLLQKLITKLSSNGFTHDGEKVGWYKNNLECVGEHFAITCGSRKSPDGTKDFPNLWIANVQSFIMNLDVAKYLWGEGAMLWVPLDEVVREQLGVKDVNINVFEYEFRLKEMAVLNDRERLEYISRFV